MSFVTTEPEALTAAAGALQGLGEVMAAQNAAAAAPTAGVVPAAADAVSALQARLFAAYGDLYQQVSTQATAVHQMFVKTLSASAASYADTESVNSAVAGSSGSGLSWLLDMLTGNGTFSLLSSSVGNGAALGAMQVSNFGSAASDLLQLGSAGFLAPGVLTQDGALGPDGAALGGAVLAGATTPAAAAGVGTGPVTAAAGRASSVGGVSVPPSWVGTAAPVSNPTPATLTGVGWTSAVPHGTPVTALPAGMPAMASAGRGGFGFGTPRYGVKPTVMPNPAVI